MRSTDDTAAAFPLPRREGVSTSEIEISVVDHLDRRLAALVDRMAADLPFGPAYSDWIWAVQESRPRNFHLSFLIVERGGRPLGVAVSYRSSLDLALYASPGVARAMRALRRLRVFSFRSWIGFLSVPFSNGPGIFVPAGTSGEDLAAIYARASAVFLERYRPAVMMARSLPAQPVRGALTALGFLGRRLPFPDTVLELDFRTFDEYLALRDKKMRYKIRSEMKTFTESGGSVQVAEDPEPFLPAAWSLFQSTISRHVEEGGGVPPIEINESFFRLCLVERPERFRLLVAQVGERLVGFFLLIHAGDCLYVRHSGQDYDVSRETKAYFNLWYGVIRYAIESGYKRLFMGTTTYFVKVQLGARLYPVDNHFYFRFKTLGRVLTYLRLRRSEIDLPPGVDVETAAA